MGQWLVCRSSLCLFYSNETSGAGEQSCLQRKKRLLGLRVCKGCHRQNRTECGCTPVCMRTFYLALTLPWHSLIAILCEIRFVLSERKIILRYLGQGKGYLRVRDNVSFPRAGSLLMLAPQCALPHAKPLYGHYR